MTLFVSGNRQPGNLHQRPKYSDTHANMVGTPLLSPTQKATVIIVTVSRVLGKHKARPIYIRMHYGLETGTNKGYNSTRINPKR